MYIIYTQPLNAPVNFFSQSNVEVFNGLLNLSPLVCSSFVNGKWLGLQFRQDHVTRMPYYHISVRENYRERIH